MMDLKAFSDKKLCVAVSGGVDSVYLLYRLKEEKGRCGYLLSAVHCEHGIRGKESVEDMRFVQDLCEAWGIPLRVFQEDCVARAKREGVSLETAARNFRYESFEKLVQEGCADYILTAHHLGDEAETVLFRLARGSALAGAAAMKAQREYFLRPLLGISKEEIVKNAKALGLAWREDCTNGELQYTRNKIRAQVLPSLEECVTGAAENLAKFALRAAEDDELLYELSQALLSKGKDFDGKDCFLVAFSDKKPLFTRAVLTAMKGLGVEKDYTSVHLDGVFALQDLERGAKISLPKGVEGEKTEKGILLRVKGEACAWKKGEEQPFAMRFDGGKYVVECSFEKVEEALRVDMDKIPQTAVYRFRKDGDFITRFGGGTKSLKKFFNEKKTPVEERAYIPLIAEPFGEVYAVCGVEISDKVKVDESTRRVLYITVDRK